MLCFPGRQTGYSWSSQGMIVVSGVRRRVSADPDGGAGRGWDELNAKKKKSKKLKIN